MLIYKNFIPYIPESGEKKELADLGYEFLRDDEGHDWYEVQNKFSESTLKIAYFSDGKIDSVSFDVSALVPRGLSVAEIQPDDIPSEFSNSGQWLFNGNTIELYHYTKEELIANAEEQKHALMSAATEVIAPLQDAVDLSMATDTESACLQGWKKYRVLLNRVDTSKAPDIEWPEKPQ